MCKLALLMYAWNVGERNVWDMYVCMGVFDMALNVMWIRQAENVILS